MKKKLVGVIILFVASEAVGLAMGNSFFGLFNQTVPPAVLTSFNKGTAHAAFISYGLGAGVVMFLVSLASVAVSRFFR